MNHRPRKRFGQHFVHDQHVLERLIRVIDPQPAEHLVEIGPGKGALTFLLLPLVERLDVVELDRDLAAALQAQGVHQEKLHVHQADALRFDFAELVRERRLRIVGNLPYNISTPLLFHLLDQTGAIGDMHFMLQKEVVERMTAQPGTSDYGRLSVMLQYRCRLEYLFDVNPAAFVPPPKVNSAVVRAAPRRAPAVDVGNEKIFAEIVAQAFGQRRKTLRNALSKWLGEDEIQRACVDSRARAQDLSLEDYAALARACCMRGRNSI